ncbi:MAG: sodium ion-translocating decarboxylase subunit beta [Chloroflexota bacterium]
MLDASTELVAGFLDLGADPLVMIMWIIAGVIIYLGIAKQYEPLLLIPIGMGMLVANLPVHGSWGHGDSICRSCGSAPDDGGFGQGVPDREGKR